MNYSELTTAIQETCEDSFTATQLATFVQQAEQLIYATVDISALRKNQTGTFTASNQYLTMPSRILYVYSLAVVNGSTYTYLINKDVNFIREAYPTVAATGVPKYYALFDEDTILVGPTPASGYTAEMHFSAYPESIVTASTTWLGTEFDSALLNGALCEAIRFQKGEADMVALYEKRYVQSVALLANIGNNKMRGDAYRDGQLKVGAK